MSNSAPERVAHGEIPIWWADAPAPFGAALHFRVGLADEPLHLSGITHLIEHLAISAAGRREHEVNGYVDETECVFYAEGERDEVLEFIALVAKAVADLSTGNLELERRVLRAEAAQREQGIVGRLLEQRFGLAGYGLGAQVELGLRWVGEEQLHAWCAAHFTRGNAGLWMTGEPPANFELGLPDGPRVPPPAPQPLPLRLPAFTDSGTGGVALSGLVSRMHAAVLAAAVAEQRLYERLRHKHGLAYAPHSDHRPLGPTTAHIVLGSDGRDEDAERLLSELWGCVSELAEDGATEEELDRARRAIDRSRLEPRTIRGDLAFTVSGELEGRPHMTMAELAAGRAAVDNPAVAVAMDEVLDAALLLGPEGSRSPVAGPRPLEAPAVEMVEGERFRRARYSVLRRRVEGELWIGERGISWRDGDGQLALEWSAIGAAEARPDGELRLVSRDGSWFGLTPYVWEDGDRARALALAHVPEELVVPAGDRALTEAIERAVERRITEPAAVAVPLSELPDELSEDEGVVELAVAVALKGLVPGLLVVTERRLLWRASLHDDRLVVPLRTVSSVSFKRSELKVAWDGGDARFSITPKNAAEPLARAIEERIAD